MMEARIRQLETLLGSAVVGEVRGTSGVAGPGTVVVLEIAGEEETYFLGSREEAIEGMDVLSVQSALGQAVSGRKGGDDFSYVTPTGRELLGAGRFAPVIRGRAAELPGLRPVAAADRDQARAAALAAAHRVEACEP